MYLSKLVLNPRGRSVLQDLSNPYQMHRTVMSGFPAELPADERILYRLEIQRKPPNLNLLVQSFYPPEWTKLNQKGYLLQPAAVKPVEYHCAKDQILRFRLLANPTKRIKKGEGGYTTRVGLQHEESQESWLIRKGEQHGFRVLNVQMTKINQPVGSKIENSRSLRITQYAIRFDGLLQVINVEDFVSALQKGIGSGKGLGFGLLSIAPASSMD